MKPIKLFTEEKKKQKEIMKWWDILIGESWFPVVRDLPPINYDPWMSTGITSIAQSALTTTLTDLNRPMLVYWNISPYVGRLEYIAQQ